LHYGSSPHAAKAEALLERDHEWAAPILWRSEFGNILTGYLSSTCSSYDCEFVALAMQLDTSLVTMDGELLRAFPNRARAL
jgi:hypothetical protein